MDRLIHDASSKPPNRRLTAAEAMAHPFFDEHIKDFGPRTPEAEKPADVGMYAAHWVFVRLLCSSPPI
jgi:hypothetical protein